MTGKPTQGVTRALTPEHAFSPFVVSRHDHSIACSVQLSNEASQMLLNKVCKRHNVITIYARASQDR